MPNITVTLKKENSMEQFESFKYNLPLQAYRLPDSNVQLINYMPRKKSISEINISEFVNIKNPEEVKNFLYGIAVNLLNLAILFVEFADGKRDSVYYHDKDIEKHFYPSTYKQILCDFKLKNSNGE